jgi:hypothetical protein
MGPTKETLMELNQDLMCRDAQKRLTLCVIAAHAGHTGIHV